MDGSGHHENERQKTEHYKPVQGQWLMHQPSMKHIMAVMAERDAALQERNLAVSEKKAAQTERDMALMQRDAAIQERNTAIMERDTAIATLQYRDNTINRDDIPSCQPGCQISRGLKHLHHHHPTSCDPSDATYYLQPPPHADASKPRKPKRVKEAKPMALNKKAVKSPRKIKKEGGDDVNKIVWKGVPDIGGEAGGDLNKQLVIVKPEWKGQELGLNQVAFDDSTMPAPGCSCTGVLRQCYKWGNGGWQSSCCTTTISMHPLPAMPNKRHARVGGRKMSGGAFSKLLSRLSAEGHDLSAPVDLKEHWAKHGTNRYITIK